MSNQERTIHIGDHFYRVGNNRVSGEYLPFLGEQYYRIRDYDRMDPFFMSLVSNSDHWLFISSTGGLTAGRRNADSALFPYDTDDKVAAGGAHTGHKAVLLVTKGRRSGNLMTLPLIYGETEGGYVIVASRGGAPTHPAWYLNLVANPEVWVQVAAERFSS